MYLNSKLAGVRIGRMYVPAELAEYTANIVQFVLASPGLEDDTAEFTIEKGEHTMFENKNQNEIIEEITNSQAETENDDEEEVSFGGIPPHIKEFMNAMAIRTLIMKSLELDRRLDELTKRVEFLENAKCSCQCNAVSEDTAA